MTREELIESLTILKEQAYNNGGNVFGERDEEVFSVILILFHSFFIF